MVHTVLTSTLLLSIWEGTRNDTECRNLQQRVIDAFSSSNSRVRDEGTSLSDSDSQWLSARHTRALVTLRSVLDREEEVGRAEDESEAVVGSSTTPPLGLGSVYTLRVEGISRLIFSRPEGYMDMLNPMDFSPVSYLGSIMNGRCAFSNQ